jgi:hypothetical protein
MQPGISSCHDDRREGGGQDETDHNRKPRPWQPDRHGRISVKGRMPRIETQITGFDRAGRRWDRLRPAGSEKYNWKICASCVGSPHLYYIIGLPCLVLRTMNCDGRCPGWPGIGNTTADRMLNSSRWASMTPAILSHAEAGWRARCASGQIVEGEVPRSG